MNSVELGKRLAKVELPNGTGTLDFSKAFEALAELSRSLEADATKRALGIVKKVAEAPKEAPPAHMAVWSTVLAVVLLCIFTIRTVSLLF